jgi:chemotaxis protein methyltransferase CheR
MIPQGDREFLSELCLVRAGLKLDPEKTYLIDSRLTPIARREGHGLAEFVEAVRLRNDERLVWAVVEALAQGETCFFRDYAVFEKLSAEVLPELARARGTEPVRVWSVGCGSGQEAHSLAMLVDEQPALAGKVELFASDLSEKALEKAQAGLYSQFEVQRGLPARRLVRHFEKPDEMFAVSPRIRQMTRWRRVNLMDDLSRLGRFDLILCRYVLSQMAPFAQARAAQNLAATLGPGGRLVLGLGETVGEPFTALAAEAGLFATDQTGVRAA